MCSGCGAPPWTRRRVLAGAGALAAAFAVPARPRPATASLSIFPRSAWAGDQLAAGPVADEADVRFLLVHHTVDRNDYPPEAVAGLLQDIHRFHTGPERGWPDIAYNFVVDRFGRVWETRAGSIDRPVSGDATGGNQGFDQKCAFLGDHRTVPPTPEAIAAMADLLAFLADRSGIDTTPGATTSFESRGSNLHPAGAVVETATITGHRTMSRTACPGDAGHAVVSERLPQEVTARRGGAPTPTTPPSAPAPTSPPSDPAPPTTATPSTTAATVAPSTTVVPRTSVDRDVVTVPMTEVGPAWAVLGGAAAVLVGGVLALRSRRMR